MCDRDGYLTASKTHVFSRVLDGFETMQHWQKDTVAGANVLS